MAIYIGLTQNLVSRYDAAWQGIPSSMKAKMDRLNMLANPVGNFRNIRPLHDIICQDVVIIKSPRMLHQDFHHYFCA